MIPVLRARESLSSVTVHAMGSGMVERAAQYSIQSQWEADADLPKAPAAPPSDADLAAMGVDPRKARRSRRG